MCHTHNHDLVDQVLQMLVSGEVLIQDLMIFARGFQASVHNTRYFWTWLQSADHFEKIASLYNGESQRFGI